MGRSLRWLLLFAHPSQHLSEVNVPLFEAARGIDNITCVDLYREYPTYQIDVDREQARLREHDGLIFLFPLYWYSTPSILKEWQDLVLEYGFAYGEGGEALVDKPFLCALSAGGSEQAFCAKGYNHFTIRQLLQPLEQMAAITRMQYLPPFALFNARLAVEEQRIEAHVSLWRRILQDLVAGDLDPAALAQLETLNQHYRAESAS